MPQKFSVRATRLFQGIGKHGEAFSIEFARSQSALLVGNGGEVYVEALVAVRG